jgi:spore coat polysaccharide biosynthesis predicted glycosyltransferase SpsG
MKLGGMLSQKNKLFAKNCLYVCFADYNIGVGHLFRSQILAKSLKSSGWTNFLLGPNITQKKIIKKKLFKKVIFSNSIDKKKLLNELDRNIFEIIKKNRINLIIIDSYLIDNKFQKKIKDKLILKINNKKKNNKYCDVILDYSFNLKRFNNDPKYLMGPKYCLVENKIKKIKKNKNKKILITFGGSNLLSQVEKTIQVLKKELPTYKTYISTPSPDFYKILKKKIINEKIILSFSLSKIVNSYKFDFIISSAGHSMYELIGNNYPSLFVGMYKNQHANINYLKKRGGAKALLYNNDTYDGELGVFLKEYKKDNKIFNINKKISTKINFYGSEDVAKILNFKFFRGFYNCLPVLQTKRLKLIPLSKKNLSELYFLRNKVSKNKMIFKGRNSLSKAEHLKWYENYYEKKKN